MKWEDSKGLEGDFDVFECTLTFCWKCWGNPSNILVKIGGNAAEIQMWYLLHTCSGCYHHTNLLGTFHLHCI